MAPGHRGYLEAHVTYLTELHFLFSKVTNNGIDVVIVRLSLLCRKLLIGLCGEAICVGNVFSNVPSH